MRRMASLVSITLGVLATTTAPTAVAAKQPEHCVYRLVAIGPGSEPGAVNAQLVDEGCYTSFEAALTVGTGTTVDLEAGVTAATLTDAMLEAELTSSSDVLLGTEYNEFNFAGASASYYAPTGCANTTWEISYVGETWNDRFESGKGFLACDRNRKFEHSNFGGDVQLCTPNCQDYGPLRNEVSSLRWKD